MFKAKVIKKYSITESIRQMEPGMTLKFPSTVAYNTIKTAMLRLKKKGYQLKTERLPNGGYQVLRTNERNNENSIGDASTQGEAYDA